MTIEHGMNGSVNITRRVEAVKVLSTKFLNVLVRISPGIAVFINMLYIQNTNGKKVCHFVIFRAFLLFFSNNSWHIWVPQITVIQFIVMYILVLVFGGPWGDQAFRADLEISFCANLPRQIVFAPVNAAVSYGAVAVLDAQHQSAWETYKERWRQKEISY